MLKMSLSFLLVTPFSLKKINFIPPCHPLFFKKINFYYKNVTRGDEGDEGCMCRRTLSFNPIILKNINQAMLFLE
jgi:hypothetical protein